jgi:hypothetical protein
MKVKELMTSDVKRCSPETYLAAFATITREGDCGAVLLLTRTRKLSA